VNYQLITDEIINKLTNKKTTPKLLIHACCAPCSSYVIEYLSNYFEITLLYYNPNIYPEEEFIKRANELKNFVNNFTTKNKVNVIISDYNYSDYNSAIKGLEDEPEGGFRCISCYLLRMEHAANYAKNNNFDYFTTSLTISPHKNSQKINEIGKVLEEKYQIKYLYSDFKKKEGYKRSCELSKQYNLYRQDYCGCIYSQKSRKVEI